jgi:hypothetical protein
VRRLAQLCLSLNLFVHDENSNERTALTAKKLKTVLYNDNGAD